MIINTLEEAEKVVNNFNELSWDGWDIVSTKTDPLGYSNKFGIFINGKWSIRKRYIIKQDGWHLPNKYRVVKNG